jgi:hypothetical protein
MFYFENLEMAIIDVCYTFNKSIRKLEPCALFSKWILRSLQTQQWIFIITIIRDRLEFFASGNTVSSFDNFNIHVYKKTTCKNLPKYVILFLSCFFFAFWFLSFLFRFIILFVCVYNICKINCVVMVPLKV